MLSRSHLFLLGLGASLVLTGCAGGQSANPSETLTINGAQPISFDPAQAQEGSWLPTFQAAYDTLILRTPDGELSPMLATDWQYDDTNTKLTLNLRSDVTFSDGASFDAEAVKANFDHFRTGSGPQGSTLSSLSAVDVVDSDTVLVTLTQPDPSLLISLSNAAGMMGSPDKLGTDEIKLNPVGTGPYILDSEATIVGSQYTFRKREGYWNPDLAKFDKVVIKVIADPTAALNALVSGQLDAALLNSKTAGQARTAGLTEHNYVNNWLGLILYDRAGAVAPALGDVRVRQAINYAIDTKSILSSIYQNSGEQTSQIFGESSTAFDPALDSTYTYDPDRSRALLAEAGHARDVELVLPVAASLDPAMIAAVAQQLGDVGITVRTQTADPSNLIGDLTSTKYAAVPITLFQPNTWRTIEQAVSPDAVFNPQQSADPVVEDLISRIRLGDADGTAAKELNRYLVDQAWFAPFLRPDQFFFTNDRVSVEPQAEQLVPSIYNYAPA